MTLRMITVRGSHYECGQQLGQACAEHLHGSLDNSHQWLPDSHTWDDYRNAAALYLAATEQAFPWVVDEIRGAADGAGMDFLDLFTTAVEEIFGTPPELVGRCSDFAACAPATDGHVLLGHNNDLSPRTQAHIVAVEWHLPDHPELFTVGVGGLYLSIGLNKAGLCLTGNELSPNDERPGIPRLLVARALLSASTVGDAVSIALHPNRASSYNNLLSSSSGDIVSVEASATRHALLAPKDGWLVHTNHYVDESMKSFESKPDYILGSISRYQRATELMETRTGPVTTGLLRSWLTDHNASPTSLCRHSERVKTVFSTVIDLTEGTVDALAGNPCEGQFERVWSIGYAQNRN